eukprot:scaffold58999_cov30-Tisochrysis_lutea.AAC.1
MPSFFYEIVSDTCPHNEWQHRNAKKKGDSCLQLLKTERYESHRDKTNPAKSFVWTSRHRYWVI